MPVLHCWCLDHIDKKAKHDNPEESCHQKRAGKHRKKSKKQKTCVKSAESVSVSNSKEQASSSDIPRLPHSPAEISANWKQLIQVKLFTTYFFTSSVTLMVLFLLLTERRFLHIIQRMNLHVCQWFSYYWVTTCLEKLEMWGNLIAVREISWNLVKVSQGKNLHHPVIWVAVNIMLMQECRDHCHCHCRDRKYHAFVECINNVSNALGKCQDVTVSRVVALLLDRATW